MSGGEGRENGWGGGREREGREDWAELRVGVGRVWIRRGGVRPFRTGSSLPSLQSHSPLLREEEGRRVAARTAEVLRSRRARGEWGESTQLWPWRAAPSSHHG